MHIEPFQAVHPRLDYISAIDSFFGAIKAEYNEYKEGGFFKKTNKEAVYIYKIKQLDKSYIGIIACTDVRDFLTGNIRKHEHTLAAKEQKQLQLMLRRKAAVKPVLLTYKPVTAINEFINRHVQKQKPFLNLMLDEDQGEHTLWKIKSANEIKELQQLFKQHVSHTYIADGHHRTSTSALMYHRHVNGKTKGNFHLLLSALFTTDNIDIQPFNRIVSGFGNTHAAGFMARMSQYFEIDILTHAQMPSQKHELTMLVQGEWYKLSWKPSVIEEYENEAAILDAAILDDKVLKGILDINDIRTDQRIKYIEGPKGLEALEKYTSKEEDSVAFCLYPIQLDEIIKVADANKVLPPKSTWFEPRMKNGLIVQEF